MDMLSTILLIITILATSVATYNFCKVLRFEREHERILAEIEKVLTKANKHNEYVKSLSPKLRSKPIPKPTEIQRNPIGFKIGDEVEDEKEGVNMGSQDLQG